MSRLAVAAVLLLGGCATGGSSVDALLAEYDGDVPGASVLVIEDGRAVVRKSFGLADVNARVRATPATNYRLASITKQFTAAAILELNLNLDDDVRKWLPSLPVEGVTLRHLLTHTSGLIDYEDVMPTGTTAQLRDADVLRLLESQNQTYFAPGTSYRYSNSGYALLALIVERVSGKSFARFLRERIFEPLGMNGTVAFEEGISTVPNRAYGTPRDQSLTSAVLGDGGIYSSIDDLAKWDAALYDPKYAVAFAPYVKTDDPAVAYGFGWRVASHRGLRMLSHGGETSGFRNALVRFPDRRLTVIVLTNRNEGEPHRLALAIADQWIR